MTTKPTAAAKPSTIKLPPRYAQVQTLIARPSGATISELASELGLLNHSVRGMLSTARSKYGWGLSKFKDGERGTAFSFPGETVAAIVSKARTARKAKAAPKAKRAAKTAKPRKASPRKARPAATVEAETAV
jgi:hypothetical protein